MTENNVPEENNNKPVDSSGGNLIINSALATGLAVLINEYLKDKEVKPLGKALIIGGVVAITVGLAFGVKSKNKE